MRIGIDLRALQVGHEFRGIGANIRAQMEALFVNEDLIKHDLFIYMYSGTNPLDTINIPAGLEYRKILMKNPKDPRDHPTKRKKAAAFAKEVFVNHLVPNTIPKTSKLDVYLQFDQALGLPRSPFIKKIVVVYDLIPLVFKSDYLPSALSVWRKHNWRAALKAYGLNIRYKAGLRVVKRANKIITISQASARDIHKYMNINKSKISVAPCSLPTIAPNQPVDLRQPEDVAVTAKKAKTVDLVYGEANQTPYILYVGGVESPRRRIEDLVAAYHQLRAEGIKLRLVLVGREFSDLKKIPNPQAVAQLKQSSYSEDIFMLGYLDDVQKDKLYSRASAFVFVSLYEGFGLPILESFEKHCPVVTYDNSSIIEVAGDAAILIDSNIESLVSALKSVIQGTAKIDQVKMSKQLSKFKWSESAKKITATILE